MARKLNLKQITALQKQYNVTSTQEGINSGQCWLMEGSVGRHAMSMLEAGVCLLPDVPRRDYYGNLVPPRTALKEGTKGTLGNAQNFWQQVKDGDFDTIDSLVGMFGAPKK